MNENNKTLFSQKKEQLTMKLLISYNLIFNEYPKLSNNFSKLLTNFSDITKILGSNKKDIFYFLYLNRINIHKILYDNEEIINIENNEENKRFNSYFYLSILIYENIDISNYTYSKDYITSIINLRNSINEQYPLKKLIIAKIIIDIINNYKENNNDFINEINENVTIIKNNINILNKQMNINLTEKNIIKIKVDKIYIMIINSLIEQKKFVNYEYANGILNQLELESINITEYMIDELLKILDINNDYIKEYMINNIEDLFNENKINFYYLLFKYLFKNYFYIYTFPLLYETRKIILKIINNKKLSQFSSFNINNEFKYRMEYIIKRLTDSDYYFNKYFSSYILPKLDQVLLYYKNILFESKKNDIILIEDIIKNNNNKLNYEKYLLDYDIAQKMNKRFSIIKYLFEKNNNNIENEEELNSYIKKWECLEKKINEKRIEEIEDDIKNIKNYLNNNENKNIFIKIFNMDIYEYIINYNINDNTQISYYYNNYNNYNNYNYSKYSNYSNQIINSNSLFYDDQVESSRPSVNDKKDNKNPYELIKFIKILKIHEKSADNIVEINNSNNFISFGAGEKITLYDNSFNIIRELDYKIGINNIIYYEDNNLEKKEINVGVCTIENIALLTFKGIFYIYSPCLLPLNKIKFYLKLSQKKYLVIGEKHIQFFENIFDKVLDINDRKILKNIVGAYIEAIKINNNICVITSNHIEEGGEDKLDFINIKNNTLMGIEIKGYSFIISKNGLTVMHNENNNNKRIILLCACKKYCRGQKNGILLIIINNEFLNNEYINNNNIAKKFYHTKNFEVYCFCPIMNIKNEDKIMKDRKIYMKYYTEYFLVGGFCKNKQKGIIKLYKIIYSDNINNIEIEYIQDISINNFKGFNQPISSIIQTTKTGNIIVTCWNGEIYLFSQININYFIFYDKQFENNTTFENYKYYSEEIYYQNDL